MSGDEHDQHILIDDLSAYADGAYLSASERVEIERHLAACDVCRDELESLRAVSRLLAELPEPDLPRSFRLSPQDLDQSAPEQPAQMQPWILRYQPVFRYASVAAALLLAVIVTIDLLPGEQDPTDEMATMIDEPAVDMAEEADEPADAPGVMGVDDRDDVPVSEPDMDQDVIEDEAAESAPVPEADRPDEPVLEPDEPNTDDSTFEAAEEAPDDADVATRQVSDPADDGLSRLQIAAAILAAATLALLLLGFVLPRWWSASARNPGDSAQ